MASEGEASNLNFFPWHEPNLVQVLILTSFIVLLNLFSSVCDKLANVGILGELLVGLIYGVPLANILETDWESSFVALGYVGLIILVLEGGMSTDLALARKNLGLSSGVAVLGLLVPILLSLILIHLAFGFSLLQAFAAGAALSTTSLGTTFSVISQAGLGKTRLGAVLTSAAVADDVVGLILLQVVVSIGSAQEQSSTGQNQDSLIGWAVGRPLLASIAMLAVSYILLRWLVTPIYLWMSRKLPVLSESRAHIYNLVVATLVSFAYLAVSSLSGTSILLGAFVAGLVLATLQKASSNANLPLPSFTSTYEHHIHQVQSYLLRPLFFASIGYAIPIRDMFGATTVWQGIVYSIIATLSKLALGAFVPLDYLVRKWRRSKPVRPVKKAGNATVSDAATSTSKQSRSTSQADAPAPTFPPTQSIIPRQPSLLPVSILLGSAMVARGEISLLIANVARETSPSLMPPELFYVVIWATVICTIIGPVTVGVVIKRMEKHDSMLPMEWGPVSGGEASRKEKETPAASPTSSVVAESR